MPDLFILILSFIIFLLPSIWLIKKVKEYLKEILKTEETLFITLFSTFLSVVIGNILFRTAFTYYTDDYRTNDTRDLLILIIFLAILMKKNYEEKNKIWMFIGALIGFWFGLMIPI